MALAASWPEHEARLRADFQEFYGIDLDHAMAGAHTPHHIACLAVQLPQRSRTMTKEDADMAWGMPEVLLASILNSLNGLIWGMSDKRKRGQYPEQVGPSRLTEKPKRSLPALAMPVDELMMELSRPRRKHG